MKMEQSGLKRRHIKFRRRGITQKKEYNKENLYHAALNNQNFRPQYTGREAGLAHSTGKSAVELSCNTIGLDCQTIAVCRTQTHLRYKGEWSGGERKAGVLICLSVSRPEKFITTRSKYLLKLMKPFVKLILFLQGVEEETDDVEMEEPEDETDRKLGGLSEMDLKVLYTYLTYRNVVSVCWLGFSERVPDLLQTRQRRGRCSNCSGCLFHVLYIYIYIYIQHVSKL
jgi:hypothetical protein